MTSSKDDFGSLKKAPLDHPKDDFGSLKKAPLDHP